MSRQIDVNSPESWDDDDRAYLMERLETVPEEHRALLAGDLPAVAPLAEAPQNAEFRLAEFLRKHYPSEVNDAESPTDTAIRLLAADPEVSDPDADDYESWKVDELRTEAGSRTPPVDVPSGARKPELIAALRKWDSEHP